ncbi:MAG: hypothetical protein LIP01_11005 [Tannerellaceae bacterium]|nr:hypothetical protein [Tannerellaceae bacterium]
MQNIIKNRQTLPDFAVQECGSLDKILELAELNGLSVTDDPEPGTLLEYQPEWVAKGKIQKNIQPATALTQEEREMAPWDGIGYMAIEINFIVS